MLMETSLCPESELEAELQSLRQRAASLEAASLEAELQSHLRQKAASLGKGSIGRAREQGDVSKLKKKN